MSIGVGGGAGDSVDTVVSDDGTYCKYPTDIPIKAETEVRLRTEPGGDPLVSSLSTVIAETYSLGEKGPGDACAMWVQIDNVPMSDGYLIEIGTSPAGNPVPSSIGELIVVVEFWTFDFTESIAPDGQPTCEPTVANAAMPGASIRANPEPLSSSDPRIVGIRTPSACSISFSARVVPTDGVAVAIGNIPLPEGEVSAAIDSLPAGGELAQSVPPTPIIGPEWLEGVVVRQLVAGEADNSGIESLAFFVLAVDDDALAADNTPGLAEFTSQIVGAELSRLIDDLPTNGAIDLEEVSVGKIGGLTQALFFDAPGADLDVGLLIFWNGPRFQIVLISGRGDGVLTQLEAITLEWYERGGAGESGAGASQTSAPEVPRTEGLWAYLPLPGQLQTIPETLTFDQEWVFARGS